MNIRGTKCKRIALKRLQKQKGSFLEEMQVRISTLKLNDEDDYLGKGIEYMQCTFSAQGHRREPCFNPTGYMYALDVRSEWREKLYEYSIQPIRKPLVICCYTQVMITSNHFISSRN